MNLAPLIEEEPVAPEDETTFQRSLANIDSAQVSRAISYGAGVRVAAMIGTSRRVELAKKASLASGGGRSGPGRTSSSGPSSWEWPR